MTNDRLPTPQPAADVPLGIQRPLLPSVPLGQSLLGQSLLQPNFLTPLGARSLSVLDPALFLAGQEADLSDWESPFADSPFFDPPTPRSPEVPPVQPKPQPVAPNPAPIDAPLNPSIDAAPLAPVPNLSPVDFPADDPIVAPSDSTSQPEAIALEPPVQRSPENPPVLDLPEATAQRSPGNSPDLDSPESTVQRSPEGQLGPNFPEAAAQRLSEQPISSIPEVTTERSPENLPTAGIPEATVQRSPEHPPASEATAPPFDSPQPIPTEPAAIDAPATVQRSPENLPAPALEPNTIAPVASVEVPPLSPIELAGAIASESAAPPPAPLQRVEMPEADPTIEPIRAENTIAPAVPEPTVSPSAAPIAEPVANFSEPTIARRAIEQPLTPPPQAQEAAQASPEESSPKLPNAEVIEPFNLAIKPPLASEPEANSSTHSEIESPTETVQPSLEPIDPEPENPIEPITPSIDDRTDSPQTVQAKVEQSENKIEQSENSVKTIASSIDDRTDSPQTVQTKVELIENSVEPIASETVDDRMDSPETVQANVEVPTVTETEIQEFNQTLDKPNRSTSFPGNRTNIAQTSDQHRSISFPGNRTDIAQTSDQQQQATAPSVNELAEVEKTNSTQNQSIDTESDSLEHLEFSPQAAPINPAQSASIAPQLQAFAETDSPQPQPESFGNFDPPGLPETPPPTSPVVEAESPQPIRSAEDQVGANLIEDSPQIVNETAVQPMQEPSIASDSITVTPQPEAVSPSSIQPEVEISSEQIVPPETSPDRLQKSDRAEEISPLPPIAENSASPIQRNVTEPGSLEAASITVPEPETIAQDSATTSAVELETTIAQTLSPLLDRSELIPGSTDEVVPSSATLIEPQLQRSTREVEPQDDTIESSELTNQVQSTNEISSSLLSRDTEISETAPANELPELPTVIQRLSILEPIAQMQPLSSTDDTVQSSQIARSSSIPELQAQQFDRLFDQLPAPNNALQRSETAPPATSPVTTEWSSIAELFEAPEASRSEPAAEPRSDRFSELSNALDLSNESNGYSDLNLSPMNAAPSDVVQAKRPSLTEVANVDNSGSEVSPSEAQESPQAEVSPEQLERLAQEIYQLVRQRLALERERFGRSGSGRSF